MAKANKFKGEFRMKINSVNVLYSLLFKVVCIACINKKQFGLNHQLAIKFLFKLEVSRSGGIVFLF